MNNVLVVFPLGMQVPLSSNWLANKSENSRLLSLIEFSLKEFIAQVLMCRFNVRFTYRCSNKDKQKYLNMNKRKITC